jgi:ArsR family transcriptional regulator, arsenate/arsenite/antimonite-responsive transcriptional repressor
MVDLPKRAPSRLHSTFLEKSLTSPHAGHYEISRKVARMNGTQAVHALGALAHETRLAIYRMLVERGPDGLSAGIIAERLGLPPSSLTFHVQHLHRAGLVTQRRLSRQLIYAADFAAMNGLIGFLTENCCGRGSAACLPSAPPARKPRKAAS